MRRSLPTPTPLVFLRARGKLFCVFCCVAACFFWGGEGGVGARREEGYLASCHATVQRQREKHERATCGAALDDTLLSCFVSFRSRVLCA